ncbi:hypothetical protein D3C87_2064540 [compost metagenome]
MFGGGLIMLHEVLVFFNLSGPSIFVPLRTTTGIQTDAGLSIMCESLLLTHLGYCQTSMMITVSLPKIRYLLPRVNGSTP